MTGTRVGLHVYARCDCGEVDAFYLDDEWEGGRVPRSCPHHRLGQVKGCMKVVAVVGVDTLQLECLRCNERVFVPIQAWDYGSWEADHDCPYWREKGE